MTVLSTFVFFLFITLIFTSTECEEPHFRKNVKNNGDDDTAESDWRTLEKNEPVPRGSHVEIDLTTGERKIKIRVSEKKDSKTSSVLVVDQNVDEKKTEDAIEDLSIRLNQIVGDSTKEPSLEKDKIKPKFRSYEELRKDLEDLNMAVKTDIEIMNSILESYKKIVDNKKPVTEEEEELQITMLTDLEYLLHQIDNAQEFVRSGGLKNVVLPSLNSTSAEVRSGTARMLGSAAQSNVAVQIAALESGVIAMLLRILTFDKTPSVRSTSLYALSCLVRRFPLAQKKFVDEGGLTVLNKLFTADASDKLKIQVKVLTFIHDLIVEKQDAEKIFTMFTKDSNSNASVTVVEESKERLKQYNTIGLETKLQEQRWCEQLSDLLIEHVSQHLDVIYADISSQLENFNMDITVEHDVIEKVLNAVISSSTLCLSDLENNKKFSDIIQFLYVWYKKLAANDGEEEEEEDTYYNYILGMIENLSWKYKISLKKQHVRLKEEL